MEQARTWSRSTQCLEYAGAGLGVAGAALLAADFALSPAGWLLFLLSNACLLVFGLRMRLLGLLALQTALSATSAIGLNNALTRPGATEALVAWLRLV